MGWNNWPSPENWTIGKNLGEAHCDRYDCHMIRHSDRISALSSFDMIYFSLLDTTCELTNDPGYVLYSSMGSFFIPLAIIIYVYIKIWENMRKRIRKRAEASGLNAVKKSVGTDGSSEKENTKHEIPLTTRCKPSSILKIKKATENDETTPEGQHQGKHNCIEMSTLCAKEAEESVSKIEQNNVEKYTEGDSNIIKVSSTLERKTITIYYTLMVTQYVII